MDQFSSKTLRTTPFEVKPTDVLCAQPPSEPSCLKLFKQNLTASIPVQ
ncbi:MAG: hypothetical protein QXO32_01015 [Candidatus Bathyarchaeia archaeon]